MKKLLIVLIVMVCTASASADVYRDYEKHVYIQGLAPLSIILGTDDNIYAAYPFVISLGYSKNYGDFEWGAAGGAAGFIMPFISVVGEWHFLRMDNISFNLGGRVLYGYVGMGGFDLGVIDYEGHFMGGSPYLSARLFNRRWYVSLGVEYPLILIGLNNTPPSFTRTIMEKEKPTNPLTIPPLRTKNLSRIFYYGAITISTGFYF